MTTDEMQIEPAWNVGGVVKVIGLWLVLWGGILNCPRVVDELHILQGLLGKGIIRVMCALLNASLHLAEYWMLAWLVVHDQHMDSVIEGVCRLWGQLREQGVQS